MLPAVLQGAFSGARGSLLLCRGCLGSVGADAVAGLCARCWRGLVPLAEDRCPRCALVHADGDCPDPTAWACGDALWMLLCT